MLTYDLAFTQGFNSFEKPRNDRPITARIGLESEAINCGISYYNATHSMGSNSMGSMAQMKKVGIDVEKNINPVIVRGEAVLGKDPDGKGFSVILDFPFFLGIEGRGSGLIWKENTTYQAFGLELRKDISFLTIGIGFIQTREITNKNQVIFQTIVKI